MAGEIWRAARDAGGERDQLVLATPGAR